MQQTEEKNALHGVPNKTNYAFSSQEKEKLMKLVFKRKGMGDNIFFVQRRFGEQGLEKRAGALRKYQALYIISKKIYPDVTQDCKTMLWSVVKIYNDKQTCTELVFDRGSGKCLEMTSSYPEQYGCTTSMENFWKRFKSKLWNTSSSKKLFHQPKQILK
jgi:hypothetical protein